jgi:hypothetical protein
LRATGRRVVTSDLVNGADFLTTTRPPRGCVGLVTNPPFNALTEFTDHAIKLLDTGHLQAVTLLWRGDHPGAAERAASYNRAARILICCWRPRWIADTSTPPRFWFQWMTWLRGHTGGPVSHAITPQDIGTPGARKRRV